MIKELRRMYINEGLSTRTIGDELGVTGEAIRVKLKLAGIERRHGGWKVHRPSSPPSLCACGRVKVHKSKRCAQCKSAFAGINNPRLAEMVRLYSAGVSIREIATTLGYATGASITSALWTLRIEGVELPRRRLSPPSPQASRGLRRRYESGNSLRTIEKDTPWGEATIKRAIERAGGRIRTRSEAQQLRFARG